MTRTKVSRRRCAPIERRAERQHGLLGPPDLARIGRGAAAHRCRSGRWVRMRRGVVRVTGAPVTWDQTARAAVLGAGELAFVSHASAVRWYGLETKVPGDVLELSAPLARHIRIAGVRAHRCGTLEPGDIVRRRGIACSSALRLVLDLSSRLPLSVLGELVDELLRRKLLRLDDLRERVDRTRPAPGRSTRKLRAVLAGRIRDYDPGESALEARIVRVIRRHGFPPPVQQHSVVVEGRAFRLDFAYPDQQLYLEGDGFGFHSSATELDRDARRRNQLVGAGWRPLSFTWRMKDREIVATLDGFYDRTQAAWRR